ncbi:DUF6414 family protein [Arthrobacter cryoconiti]|uniref:Phage portal protein n=1 Tax=Arthrobacter cryoconiti TaxID=748907 RepID=A0ABV8R539_9MICC|nr:hypothetical protein [Arthrobacter cryoconiti]MCC9066743.1 hypothetical protein [Arthrobacter cryoconiti]
MIRKLGRAFGAFWKTLRAKQAAPGTLREFVYLDETSVESLLASLDGEVLTGITESRTKGHDVGIAATGEAIGVPTGLSPSFTRSRSITVEEQRKSVAQSAFARFRSRHYRNLRLHATENSNTDRLRPDAIRVPIASLLRGDLIEVDARLGASEVFQVRAVIDSMIGVVDAYPDLMGATETAAIRAAAPLGDLLGSLSQGLIPIEGEVAGLRYVRHDDFEGIVSADKASQLQAEGATVRDVVVAGVSLEPLYWQDVRRVLFSNQTYRLLGRLVNNGARDGWSSLKITEVLSRVNAQLADTIDSFGPLFLSTLQQGVSLPPAPNPSPALMHEILRAYVEECANLNNVTLTNELNSELNELISASPVAPSTVTDWTDLQKSLAERISTRAEQPLSPEALLDLRGKFPQASVPTAPPTPPIAHQIEFDQGEGTGPIYLEMEIIAIYW